MTGLDRIRNILTPLCERVGHYETQKKGLPRIVWAEDGDGGSKYADNKNYLQIISGTIDLYTDDEDDPLMGEIQDALNEDSKIAWHLNSIQYDDETGIVHYEWVWETFANG